MVVAKINIIFIQHAMFLPDDISHCQSDTNMKIFSLVLITICGSNWGQALEQWTYNVDFLLKLQKKPDILFSGLRCKMAIVSVGYVGETWLCDRPFCPGQIW